MKENFDTNMTAEFLIDQRYTSLGEPELGMGIVTALEKGKVTMYFPLAKETRLYAIESAPLVRVIFKVGDQLIDLQGDSMLVNEVVLEDGLYIYVGERRRLKESELNAAMISHSVEDRLLKGDVEHIEHFDLRRESLFHDYQRRLSPVYGFVGGKIDLIPHQLYIAHEVSARFVPRVLLSDQVGLGKTIEASLILHRLLVTGRISRALIVVPESLMHQWFVEMYRKFNLWFHIFDEERSASLEESAPDGNPFLDDQLIICSIEFLTHSYKRSQQAIEADWDILVVDEAHHLSWSVDEVSPEYRIVEQLSQRAQALLLLTATPEQLGVESHFARLRLLDPIRFNDYDSFIKESKDNKTIAHLVEQISDDKKLNEKELTQMTSLFSKDRVSQFIQNTSSEKDNLIEDLLDQYGPGRVIFRNTRLTMHDFPKRKAHLVALKPTKNHELWKERAQLEFLIDAKEMDQKPNFQMENDPKMEWLLNKMEEIYPTKMLLICSSKEKVLSIAEAISQKIKINVGVFHEDLTLVQRDRNAAWFADHDSAQILICSEIGSEGRNFQFVHHLVLFDLPIHPELLEQRIGRLDRIGQKEDIHIHIPFIEDSAQHVLVKWYHEALDAFETNLEGGNLVFDLFHLELMELAKNQNIETRMDALNELIKKTKNAHQKLKENLSEGRDRLLEMNSCRPKIAQKLIEQIKKEDQDRNLEKYLTKIFHAFDIEMEDLAARTYLLYPASGISEAFPSIPKEGVQVSFDRKRAIAREDIGFLSWEHPMALAAIDKVLSSDFGNASFGVLKNQGQTGLLLELIFVLETAGEKSIDIDRFLPKMPIRIVVDHSMNEVTTDFPIDALRINLRNDDPQTLLQNETLTEVLLPNMIELAKTLAQKNADEAMDKALLKMKGIMHHEINRLVDLQLKNPMVGQHEINYAKEEFQILTEIIQKARLRLDCLQLIRIE